MRATTEQEWIEAEFRGLFDAAKLTEGWRFRLECQRRKGRPVVAVVLEPPAGDVIAVRVRFQQPVRSRGELKPVVMEVMRRLLEKGVERGLREAWFEGANGVR